MKKVIIRALSGIVYIAVILAAIFSGKIVFCILTMLFAALGVYEYFLMEHAPYGDKKQYWLALVVDIIFAALLPLSTLIDTAIESPVVVVLGLYLLIRAIISLKDKGEHAMREVAKSLLGVVYLGVPMLMLNLLYQYKDGVGTQLVLLMLVTIWINDTGAFCFGSLLGKHRLCERLSPKKSWEGFWGGMLCSIIFGWACYTWFNSAEMSIWAWLALGALISLFATWGDLFESMLKRTVKVKDSGKLIPGHGGILDRIDSLLFVAPATLLFLLIVY